MATRFKFKTGRNVAPGISPQVVGNELQRIHDEHGRITPRQVVLEAEPQDSPLHPCFEWDDKIAAEEHRLHQARQVVNSVVIVSDRPGSEPVQAFVSVRVVPYEEAKDAENHGRAYVPAKQVADDPELYEQHLSAMKSRLLTLRRELQGFEELRRVVEAIDQV